MYRQDSRSWPRAVGSRRSRTPARPSPRQPLRSSDATTSSRQRLFHSPPTDTRLSPWEQLTRRATACPIARAVRTRHNPSPTLWRPCRLLAHSGWRPSEALPRLLHRLQAWLLCAGRAILLGPLARSAQLFVPRPTTWAPWDTTLKRATARFIFPRRRWIFHV